MKRTGFTIVEIFIILSIICVMAGFLVGAAMRSRQKQKNVSTYIFLDSIAAALEMYKDDFGAYPPDNDWGTNPGASALYYYLGATFRRGRNADKNAGPYLRYISGKHHTTASVGMRDFTGNGSADAVYSLIDGWGNPIQYDSTPSYNVNSYDLWSTGPSGETGDNITNWE